MPVTNMFNRDETALYVHVGAKSSTDASHFARLTQSRTTTETRGNRSLKNAPGNDLLNLSGLRISISTLIGGGGSHAPLVVTVTGLSPMQLPGGPSVRFYLPEVDVHLALLRGKCDSDATSEVDHWADVDEKIYMPWIEEQMNAGGFLPGNPARVAFDSMDGCGTTLKAFASQARLKACVGLGIRRNKGHRSRTHKEQPCDGGKMYSAMKKDEPRRTATTGNQKRRSAAISERIRRDDRVNLGTKLAPIADFCATTLDFEGQHLSEQKVLFPFFDHSMHGKKKTAYHKVIDKHARLFMTVGLSMFHNQ